MAEALAKGSRALEVTLEREGIDPVWIEWLIEWRKHGRYPRDGGMEAQDGLYFPVMHLLHAELCRIEDERERKELAKMEERRRG